MRWWRCATPARSRGCWTGCRAARSCTSSSVTASTSAWTRSWPDGARAPEGRSHGPAMARGVAVMSGPDAPYSPGLEGVIATATSISYLDVDHEQIVVRGYDLME